MSRVLAEYTPNISFADPALHFGLPHVLKSQQALHRYARTAMPVLTRRPYNSFYPEETENPWGGRTLSRVFSQGISFRYHGHP